MPALFLHEHALRRRAVYQALLFAAFNMFWVAVPLVLARRFHSTAADIALFALAGAGGALAAPLTTRLVGRARFRLATWVGCVVLLAAEITSIYAVETRLLAVFATCAVLADGAVMANQTIGRLTMLDVPSERRGRANSLYMTTLFLGGSLGSVSGTLLFSSGGWPAVAAAGATLAALVLLLELLRDDRVKSSPRPIGYSHVPDEGSST